MLSQNNLVQQNNQQMSGKIYNRNIETPDKDRFNNGIRCLEATVNFSQELCASQKCQCLICHSKSNQKHLNLVKIRSPDQFQADKNFLKVLNGLCQRQVPGIKIFFPDICFVERDELSVFHSEPKNNRLIRISGTIPSKSLFSTMVRLKVQYKGMLEENFQKNMLDKIDPKFMHQKYMDVLLPSHFHDGFDSNKLHENKKTFKDYILHKNANYVIPAIQQHKINENQPFCVVYFTDGNSQLFNQREFEKYVMLKVPSDISYVQSFIKPKQESESVFTSQYTQSLDIIKTELFRSAEAQILVLIGGLDKYSERYRDLEEFEDNAIQMMKNYPDEYIQYCTYRIIHYLAMVSRIYVRHIKINWTMNDIGQLFVQKIFEFQTSDISERPLVFRLPPKGENLEFYKDSKNFLTIYHEMKKITEQKRLRIQKKLHAQKEQISRTIDHKNTNHSTIDRTSIRTKAKLNPIDRLSRTFDVDEKKPIKFSVNKAKLLQRLNIEHRYQDSHKMAKNSFFKSTRRNRIASGLEKYNF